MELEKYIQKKYYSVEQIVINNIKNNEEYVLFGAGSGGIKVYEFIEKHIPNGTDRIKCFIDNNPLKRNTYINGKIVLCPNDFFTSYNGELIIISCGEGDEIKKQLSQYSIPDSRIYIPDVAAIKENDAEYIWGNMCLLNMVYNELCDEKSRKVFCNILNYKITHEMQLIEEIADDSEEQYFDKDLIKYSAEDIFLDCGGYTGDTVLCYLKHNMGKYKKIICLEPDEDNYNIIRDNILGNGLCNIELYNIAAYNCNQMLKFDKIGSGSGKIIDKIGEKNTEIVMVEADRIDNIINGAKVDFIKMDIEGAEYKALIGAVNTIQEYRPTLMISVYHKQDDFITIPLLIKSLNPNYKLYMRHYRKMSVQETVLYAI